MASSSTAGLLFPNRCPHCGVAVDGDAERCWQCGVRPYAHCFRCHCKRGWEVVCPNCALQHAFPCAQCGWLLTAGASCPRCGDPGSGVQKDPTRPLRLDANEATVHEEDLLLPCPRCGTAALTGQTFCWQCGHSFVSAARI